MIEKRIRINGRHVRYIEAGAGPPVIFAAGLGISADFYKPNMAALAQAGWRAITPDLPGHGKTRGAPFGSTVDEMATHLIAFADALEVAHATWIGHSIGAQTVLALAGARPDLVNAAVLAGPTGGYGRRLLHQTAALAVHAVIEPWRLMKAVLRDYARLSPFNYVGTWLKARHDDPVQQAGAVRCPVLILVGTRDRIPPREFIAHLLHKLDDAVVRELPGGQHGLPLDAQTQFDRAVIEFLKQQR